jgi:hypothetical protein
MMAVGRSEKSNRTKVAALAWLVKGGGMEAADAEGQTDGRRRRRKGRREKEKEWGDNFVPLRGGKKITRDRRQKMAAVRKARVAFTFLARRGAISKGARCVLRLSFLASLRFCHM